MKSSKAIRVTALLVGAALLYGGWLGYLAWRNLVTLNVRNMDVREVVKKMERQTWEDIFVDKSVQGKITLNVRRMPLEEALRIIGDKIFSRSSVLYPLYSNDRSLTALEQALRSEVDPMTHGWTNLQARAFGFGGMPSGGMPPFAMMAMGAPGQPPAPNQRVSLNIVGKDVAFAIVALSRFAQARVVPEDGTAAMVSLTLKEATVSKAVAQLAKAAQRKWTTVYALQAGFGPGDPGGPGGPPQFAGRDGDGPRRFAFGAPEMSDEKREEMRKQREAFEEELKNALPSEERQKLDQAQQERERLMQEMANMTPEQMRDRMMQMNGAQMRQMNINRMMNSTPEQRAQMNQRMNQMRNQMREQGGFGFGPGGGPGRGPDGGGGPGGPPR